MPFGLKCAAQTFQRFMDRVTQGLRNIFVYLDDILIASKDATEHEEDLRALFQRLEEHGLVVKRAKCVLDTVRSAKNDARKFLKTPFDSY